MRTLRKWSYQNFRIFHASRQYVHYGFNLGAATVGKGSVGNLP